jgi:hypothetical protein
MRSKRTVELWVACSRVVGREGWWWGSGATRLGVLFSGRVAGRCTSDAGAAVLMRLRMRGRHQCVRSVEVNTFRGAQSQRRPYASVLRGICHAVCCRQATMPPVLYSMHSLREHACCVDGCIACMLVTGLYPQWCPQKVYRFGRGLLIMCGTN